MSVLLHIHFDVKRHQVLGTDSVKQLKTLLNLKEMLACFFKITVSQESLYQIRTDGTCRGNRAESLKPASVIPSLTHTNSVPPLHPKTYQTSDVW